MPRENGAAQGKKARCLGVLTAFRYALIGSSPYKRDFFGKGYTLQEKFFTLPFYSENAGSCEPAFYVDFDYTRAAVIMAIL